MFDAAAADDNEDDDNDDMINDGDVDVPDASGTPAGLERRSPPCSRAASSGRVWARWSALDSASGTRGSTRTNPTASLFTG